MIVNIGSRDLYGRVVMDGTKVRIRFDGAPPRQLTLPTPKVSAEDAEKNRRINIQSIGNFYAASLGAPRSIRISFLPGTVRIDGKNVAMPTVSFQRTTVTYTYRPQFNVC